ncbi:MAG TPA: sigma-70 family RNA polymerase sigma factor [Bacillota bacterium]|nr:sigma-70 family RNA polymerase sigma factor [Bacillota bacterium]
MAVNPAGTDPGLPAASFPDELLVSAAKRGDRAAFGELVRRYERKVYNLAYRYAGNSDDAADLAQEAFLKAFCALGTFRGRSAFSTWLYRVTANVCLDALRGRQRRRTLSLDQAPPGREGDREWELADPRADLEEQVQRREVQSAVHRAIGRLGPEHRLVVVLRDLQGFSYQEISRILGLNLGTVKSRLNRARLALRDELAGAELSSAQPVSRSDRGDKGAAGGGDNP